MVFLIFIGINDLVILWLWRVLIRVYSIDQYFYKEEEDEIVIYVFKLFFLKKDWFVLENMFFFGEIKMNCDYFFCMRSFSKDFDVIVNEVFFKNFEVFFLILFFDFVSKIFLIFLILVENI